MADDKKKKAVNHREGVLNVGLKLGMNKEELEKVLPSEEVIDGEMRKLDSIKNFIEQVPPKVVEGCIFYMTKGLSFAEASGKSLDAYRTMAYLGKKEAVELVEEIKGVMVSV